MPGTTWSDPVVPKSAASDTSGNDPVSLGRLWARRTPGNDPVRRNMSGSTWSDPVEPKSAASDTSGNDPVSLGRLRT